MPRIFLAGEAVWKTERDLGVRPIYKPLLVFLDSRPAWIVYFIYQKFLAFMSKHMVDACFRKVDIYFILKSSLIFFTTNRYFEPKKVMSATFFCLVSWF